MAEEARRELGEAVEAVEGLIDSNKMPFGRWLIKLIVEKLIVPVIVPSVMAVVTSVCGWYFYGQAQLEGVSLEAGARAAEAEVEKLDRARELVADVEPDSPRVFATSDAIKPLSDSEVEDRVDEIRDRWEAEELEEETLESGLTDDAINAMDLRILEQKSQFPEGYVRDRLSKVRK